MRLNEGVEWAVHCCSILAALPPERSLSARHLAQFFDLPAEYLAKHLQALSGAGLVVTRRGRSGGCRLARPPQDISLLDIVEAIDGRDPSFRCTEIRRRGPCAHAGDRYPRPCGIARAMWHADTAWRQELAKVSLSEIARIGAVETPHGQIERSAAWLQEKLK